MMKIAIASGKGGTGKTTVAVNLAYVASRQGKSAGYLDCDVEEPNGAIFLKPTTTRAHAVKVSMPEVDASKCTGCGKCGNICQFSAILALNNQVLTFPELCHGCGGCWLVCPTGAITEVKRETGKLELGMAGDVQFVHGILNVGEVMSPPVINAVKKAQPDVDMLIIDSPPGTSCPVIESVRDTDFIVLVTEPTPFGLNDLKLAVGMVRALTIPFAVVINRSDVGDEKTTDYCHCENIDILAEIPDDRDIAEAYSKGQLACEALPVYRKMFTALLAKIESASKQEAGAGREV